MNHIIKKLSRLMADARNAKGMIAGMPKITVDCMDLDVLLIRLNAKSERIAELENPWISVEDGLPYESAFVIAKSTGVTESKHQTGILVLYYCTAYTKSERFQSQHRASHVTVTHWMPLPI